MPSELACAPGVWLPHLCQAPCIDPAMGVIHYKLLCLQVSGTLLRERSWHMSRVPLLVLCAGAPVCQASASLVRRHHYVALSSLRHIADRPAKATVRNDLAQQGTQKPLRIVKSGASKHSCTSRYASIWTIACSNALDLSALLEFREAHEVPAWQLPLSEPLLLLRCPRSTQLQQTGNSDAQDGSTGGSSDVYWAIGRLCAQAGACECPTSRLLSQWCPGGEASSPCRIAKT